jgi:hypothetical protein
MLTAPELPLVVRAANRSGRVRRIEEFCGRALSPEAEASMRRYLAENPADKHGKQVYRFADTGLDPATARAPTRCCQECFAVPFEEV